MPDTPNHIAILKAAEVAARSLEVDSSKMNVTNDYVGWIDIMGASNLMTTSMQKSANAIARIHLAVSIAKKQLGGQSKKIRLIPINDGVFILGKKQKDLVQVIQHTFALLAAKFVSTNDPFRRFVVRGSIAYGPVVRGRNVRDCLSKSNDVPKGYFNTVAFGPPIFQAYSVESTAAPFGIAVHESARAFAPSGAEPFQFAHFRWWQNHYGVDNFGFPDLPPLSDLAKVLIDKIGSHLDWIASTEIHHVLGKREDKSPIQLWQEKLEQYFWPLVKTSSKSRNPPKS